jgi:hypothetical protein
MTPDSIRRTRQTSSAAAGIALTIALSSCASATSTSAGGDRSSRALVPRPDAASTPAPTSSADYVDGEYSADGWYGGLPSSIGVTVTLADDVVTSVAVTPYATNPTSLDLQQRFAEALPAVVVGSDIDEVRIDRLAGSSGTPVGFHDALEQIKSLAAAE